MNMYTFWNVQAFKKVQAFLVLEKNATKQSRTSRFSFWASTFSFSLAQWARGQACHLPIKSFFTNDLKKS